MKINGVNEYHLRQGGDGKVVKTIVSRVAIKVLLFFDIGLDILLC